MDACVAHDVDFSITVARQKPVVAAIETIADDAWFDIAYTDGGVAQVTDTIVGDYRLVVVCRTKIVDDPDLPALFADWRHHAFITNRPGDAVELDRDHRAHAVVAVAIRDLKYGAGLNHCLSGVFNTNTAWLVAATLAHNLIRWTQRLGATRRRCASPRLPASAAEQPRPAPRTARRFTLHLPVRWPWQHVFEDTLERRRALLATV